MFYCYIIQYQVNLCHPTLFSELVSMVYVLLYVSHNCVILLCDQAGKIAQLKRYFTLTHNFTPMKAYGLGGMSRSVRGKLCSCWVGDVVCTNCGVHNNTGPSTVYSLASIHSHVTYKCFQAIDWNVSYLHWTTDTPEALARRSKNHFDAAFRHSFPQYLVEHLLVYKEVLD